MKRKLHVVALLDHILVHQRWKSSCTDYWFSKLNYSISDHKRLNVKFRIKWRIIENKKRMNRVDLAVLDDPKIKQEFVDRLIENIEIEKLVDGVVANVFPSDDSISNLESQWKVIKDNVKENLEWLKGKKREKISISSESTQKKWLKNLPSKRSFDSDYEKLWAKLGCEMQKAADCGDLRYLYQLMKKGIGFYGRKKGADANKFGEVIKNKCARILNIQPSLTTVQNEFDSPVPTLEEIADIIKTMKNGKSPGEDRIPMEIWKIPRLTRILYDFIIAVWKEKQIPSEWRRSIIVPVPKSTSNKFRPVSLINTGMKVYLKLLMRRTQERLKKMAGESQSGFISKRSCFDQITLVLRHIERAIEFDQELVICFADIQGAFDRISRVSIINALVDAGESSENVERIKDVLTNTTALVRSGNDISNEFETQEGTPQGSALSPQLFIGPLGHIAINELKRHVPGSHGEYADDLYNILNSMDKIPELMFHLRQSMSLVGLELEPSKTEFLRVKDKKVSIYHLRNPEALAELKLENLDNVNLDEFLLEDTNAKSIRYLGTQLGSKMMAMRTRIALANTKFNQLYKAVWSRNNLSYSTKFKVFNAVVISTLMYGLKCHNFTRREMKGLDNFCLRKLKSIFNYDFDAKISYKRLEAELSFFNIEWKWPRQRLQEARLGYFIECMKKPEFLDIIIPKDDMKRCRGRPKFRLIDAIKDDLEDVAKIDFTQWEKIHKFNSKSSRAEKILTLCKLWEIDKENQKQPKPKPIPKHHQLNRRIYRCA